MLLELLLKTLTCHGEFIAGDSVRSLSRFLHSSKILPSTTMTIKASIQADFTEEIMVDDYEEPPQRTAAATTGTEEQPKDHVPTIPVSTKVEELEMGNLPSARTDPFAKREGKTLTWTKVNMTLTGKGDEPDRRLLKDVWGEVPMTKTTAIMGPSGAGYVWFVSDFSSNS